MENYKTEHKDYRDAVAVMVSTDRKIFDEKSAVRTRMIEYGNLYKELHIIIFTTGTKFPAVQKIGPNISVYATRSLSKLSYIGRAQKIGRRIFSKISKETPVVILCQDPFETGLVGKALNPLRAKNELVVQIHTDIFSPYFYAHSVLNKIRTHISKTVLPQADVIQSVSRRVADTLVERGFAAEKIVLKPIKVNVDHFTTTPVTFDLHERFPQFKQIILMASRLEAEKNIDEAIDAWKKVQATFPDAGLLIIGSGSLSKALEEQIKTLGLEKSVILLGWQEDLVSYYKGADIFLLTSFFEGYGMTLKEAEASGAKIVSTDVGIAREVGATIIPGFDSESIAQTLIAHLSL